jgi:hypothetical protein
VLIAAALIGCTGSGDDDSLGGTDGGSESSSSGSGRGRAGSGGDDDGDEVGELGARAGRGGAEDAGAPVESDAATMGEPGEEPEPCKPGEVVCLAGSCTRCELLGGSGGSSGAGGTGGSAGAGAPAACDHDADSDGVCDPSDLCPGPDQDANADGYADGCDQVLAKFELPPSTKTVQDTIRNVRGVFGTLTGSSKVLLDTEYYATGQTVSLDVSGGAASTIAAADQLRAQAETLSAAICTSVSVGVSGQCWRVSNQYVNLTGKKITRFVLVLETVDIVAAGTETDVRAGGRWEIRGY